MSIFNIAEKKKAFLSPEGGAFSVRNITDLRDLIKSSAALYGDKTVFMSKKEKGAEYFDISYMQFKSDIEALGTTLVDMGLEGEKIAVIGSNCYQWVVAYFAIVNGVGTVVPIDKELKKEEIENLMKTSGCKGVFHTKEYEKYFEKLNLSHTFLLNAYEDDKDSEINNSCRAMIEEGYHLLEIGNTKYIEKNIDAEALSILLFTSGTLGKPKGVMLSHTNLVTVIMGTSKIIQLRPDDTALSILPIHHTFESTMTIMTIIYQGCSTAFYEGLKYVMKNIQESRASVLIGVPLIVESLYSRIWQQAKKTNKEKLLKVAIKTNTTAIAMGIDKHDIIFKSVYNNFGGRLRVIMSGAAALNPATLRGFMDLGFEMIQGYGLTECAPLIAATPIWENIYRHAGSCGKIMPGGEVRIESPDANGIGEICYRGNNVMIGYYNMPEETNEVIKNGWFHTGDLGFVDSEGWLYITGRAKNIIVTKTGKNIYPEELEILINSNEYVSDSMVYGLDQGEQDTTVILQIYPDYDKIEEKLKIDIRNTKLSTKEKNKGFKTIRLIIDEEIKKFNDTLAVYKRIKTVIVREEDFIRTTTKKIKRNENIKQFE